MIGTNLVDNLGGIAFWRNLSLWACSLKTLLKTREPQICVDPRSTWLGWQHAAGCVIAGPLWKSGVPQGSLFAFVDGRCLGDAVPSGTGSNNGQPRCAQRGTGKQAPS